MVGLRLGLEPPTPARMLLSLGGRRTCSCREAVISPGNAETGSCLPRGTLQGAAGSAHPVKCRGHLGGEEKGLKAAEF